MRPLLGGSGVTSQDDGARPGSVTDWRPAFPGQRPPFQPGNQYRVGQGNQLANRHGAYSPTNVEPRAAELVAMVEAQQAVSWLSPIDHPMLWDWARARATYERVQSYVEGIQEQATNGVGDLEDKRVLAAYSLLDRAQGRLANMTSRLGFDPLSRARLGRDVAAAGVDMARLLSAAADEDEGDDRRADADEN